MCVCVSGPYLYCVYHHYILFLKGLLSILSSASQTGAILKTDLYCVQILIAVFTIFNTVFCFIYGGGEKRGFSCYSNTAFY